MADFRLRTDARKWFSELRDNRAFRVDFDIFYFCFMAGIAGGHKPQVQQSETAQLVDYFPERYRGRREQIVAMFLARELQELAVDSTQKEIVNSAISKLIDPHAQNFLSDEGVKLFNNYANGGYELLIGWFDDKPRQLDTFLRAYKRFIDETVASDKLPS